MFNRTKAITKLFGEVGWKQPINPEYFILDSENLESRSGRKFTDNRFVKVEILQDTSDYKDATQEEFNQDLKDLQNESITSVLDQVFGNPEYIDRQLLYQFPNNKIDTDNLPSGFVGYRIYQSLDKTQAFEITRDLLEFDGNGTITLAIYNSSKKEPLFTKEVTITSTQQEVELNWRLDNTTQFYKGEYYYGYLTNGVSIKPIKRDYENANYMSVITGLKFENIQVIYTPETNEIFNLNDINEVSECWGLNPDVTVYDDYTDIITQNSFLFATAIQLQGQIKALEQYLSSIRSNRNERIAEEFENKIVIELDGLHSDNITKIGIKQLLVKEISRAQEEIKKLKDGYFTNGYLLNTLS